MIPEERPFHREQYVKKSAEASNGQMQQHIQNKLVQLRAKIFFIFYQKNQHDLEKAYVGKIT